jgi:hypothetical protein
VRKEPVQANPVRNTNFKLVCFIITISKSLD